MSSVQDSLDWTRLRNLLKAATHHPSTSEIQPDLEAPGMEVLISSEGRVIFNEAFGSRTLFPEVSELKAGMVFDVASLSKALVTTVLVMKLVESGQLDLDRKVGSYLSGFSCNGKGQVKVRDLLTHSAGFADHKKFYQEIAELDSGPKSGILSSRGAHDYVINHLLRAEPDYLPGSKAVYSDLGFMVLGHLIESLNCGQQLDKLAQKEIFIPLGIESSGFVNLETMKVHKIEPVTEIIAATADCPWRKKIIVGEVHDDNCWAMGGIAGHAGLFSTALDVFKISNTLLDCYHGKSDFISREVIREFWRKDGSVDQSTWALGWDTPSPDQSSAGQNFSSLSVGHLGYTGCSIWIDLPADISIILLTNRVHPSPENKSIKDFRPALHDMVRETLEV